jgi:hypothetical protein
VGGFISFHRFFQSDKKFIFPAAKACDDFHRMPRPASLALSFCCLILASGWTFAQTRSDQSAATSPTAQVASLTASLPDAPTPVQTTQQKNPPSSSEPTLQSLGFPTSVTHSNPKEQALLNKRTHMLKVHQTLGLITTIPMVATLFTGPLAKAKGKNGQTITEPTPANLDFHIALGGLTTGLYWTTAYYAIFTPKIPGVQKRGAIRVHEALAWIHGPGMILTPILGIMAYRQENAGEKVHGIASLHGTVAYITTAAYGASIVAVSWPIHFKHLRF